jgi:hypothetical protein
LYFYPDGGVHKSKTFEKPLAKRLSKVHNPNGAYSGIKYLKKFLSTKILESSTETLHPPALVYSCTSPRFYLLKGSDHVVST